MSTRRFPGAPSTPLRLTVAGLAVALSCVSFGAPASAAPTRISASGGAQAQPADIGPVFPPHCGHCWNPG